MTAKPGPAGEGVWELLLWPGSLGLGQAPVGLDVLGLEGTVAEVEAGPGRSKVWVEAAQKEDGLPLRLSLDLGGEEGLPEVGARVGIWLAPGRARLVRTGEC